jgi:hypothetical protein
VTASLLSLRASPALNTVRQLMRASAAHLAGSGYSLAALGDGDGGDDQAAPLLLTGRCGTAAYRRPEGVSVSARPWVTRSRRQTLVLPVQDMPPAASGRRCMNDSSQPQPLMGRLVLVPPAFSRDHSRLGLLVAPSAAVAVAVAGGDSANDDALWQLLSDRRRLASWTAFVVDAATPYYIESDITNTAWHCDFPLHAVAAVAGADLSQPCTAEGPQPGGASGAGTTSTKAVLSQRVDVLRAALGYPPGADTDDDRDDWAAPRAAVVRHLQDMGYAPCNSPSPTGCDQCLTSHGLAMNCQFCMVGGNTDSGEAPSHSCYATTNDAGSLVCTMLRCRRL